MGHQTRPRVFLDSNVLFSAYRTSGTWYEGPVIADVDMDQNTEIVVNNNNPDVTCPNGGSMGTPYVDPIHPGARCDDDGGCREGSSCVAGFCRCTTNEQCCAPGENLLHASS